MEKSQEHTRLLLWTKKLGEFFVVSNNLSVAGMHHYIGIAHEIIADSVTAIVSMSKALRIRRQKHGEDHTDVVGTQRIIGRLKFLRRDKRLQSRY